MTMLRKWQVLLAAVTLGIAADDRACTSVTSISDAASAAQGLLQSGIKRQGEGSPLNDAGANDPHGGHGGGHGNEAPKSAPETEPNAKTEAEAEASTATASASTEKKAESGKETSEASSPTRLQVQVMPPVVPSQPGMPAPALRDSSLPIRMELRLTSTLSAIHSSTLGPLPNFIEQVRQLFSAAVPILPQRLRALSVRGEFVKLNLLELKNASFLEFAVSENSRKVTELQQHTTSAKEASHESFKGEASALLGLLSDVLLDETHESGDNNHPATHEAPAAHASASASVPASGEAAAGGAVPLGIASTVTVGSAVVITGLLAPDNSFNGLAGRITKRDSTDSGVWKVKLTDGRNVRIRASNLRAAEGTEVLHHDLVRGAKSTKKMNTIVDLEILPGVKAEEVEPSEAFLRLRQELQAATSSLNMGQLGGLLAGASLTSAREPSAGEASAEHEAVSGVAEHGAVPEAHGAHGEVHGAHGEVHGAHGEVARSSAPVRRGLLAALTPALVVTKLLL